MKLVKRTGLEHLSAEELDRLSTAVQAQREAFGAPKRRRRRTMTASAIEATKASIASRERRDAKTRAVLQDPRVIAKVEAAKASGELYERVRYDYPGQPRVWVLGTKEDADPVRLFVWVKTGVLVTETGEIYVEPWARKT